MSVFKEPPRRDKQLLIRLASNEKDRLEAEAAKRGLTVADLVRQAVNAFVSPKPKSPKKRSKSA